ncbi:MAG: hypothetical protein EU542_01895 [Promethearchaeota archaeon]|nr:MAG: hypothetical protein EU542_01895 [Candidatus Lokiarchaeota archaeon]
MVKRKENLLAAGMLCLVIAILLNILGNAHVLLNLIIMLFLGLTIFFNAKYLVLSSLDKKKK